MASESSSSRSSSSADSYIGSLISLTSKSEIRYEGVLYNINTDESSIGLRNVRAFGTEGRKQDGPQIPPSDKVYEYILFRGSDIKDLQVKSSPPVQPPTQSVNNDPAIIQSHYPQVSTFTSLPPAVSGSAAVLSSQPTQFGFPGSNFQGAPPFYQPGSNLGSWGASPPPPNANGSGLAMPMYWQGYYAPPNGLPLHQQSLLHPQPGLSMPPSMQQQQPLQYPNFNASLPAGASNLPRSNFPEVPSLLLPVSSSSVNSSSASLPPATLPSNSSLLPPATLTSSMPPAPSTTIASDVLLSMMPNRIPSSILPTATLSASLLPRSSLNTSTPELSAIVPPIANMANAVSGQTLPYHSTSQSTTSTVGASNSVQTETPASSLVTPGQLLQSGTRTTSSPLSSEAGRKDVVVVQVSQSSSLEPTAPVVREAQPPLLPLPAQPHQKVNGAPYLNRHGYRGRERGRGAGSSHPVAKFTEEFDFAAMNEKFKKEEVWGDLGKSSKSHAKDKEGDGNDIDADDYQDKDDAPLPKPVYNKDDFFDSISCNTLNRDSNERTKFSERRKMDTETFGEFSRYRGGRGGRGGRFRGGHYGRGYGYGEGRGRGRSIPSRAS